VEEDHAVHAQEIIGRIVEILNKPVDEEDIPDEIQELITEWRYS
jgi:hypothetical protein